MQKKIIALAVAGLVSGVAFAQTNVTVYGAIDMAYISQSDAVDGSGTNAYNALDTNGWDASWFGLKGTEDLGNGLTASFQAEMGILPDNQNAATQQRSTFVKLEGKNWGSIKAGNYFIDTVLFNTKGGFDNYGMSEKAIRVGMNTWANNAITYTSPNWSGVRFNVGYSSNFAFTRDDNANQDSNNRVWFGDVSYGNGPLFVGASYSHFSNDAASYYLGALPNDIGGTNNSGYEWNIGAAYDFKVANVGLVYNSYNVSDAVKGWGEDYSRNAWRLNVGVPITAKDSVYLSYVDVNNDYDSDIVSDAHQKGFGLGYKHNLSKRTSLYAQAYFVEADDATFISFKNDFSETLQNGYQVGVRHTF